MKTLSNLFFILLISGLFSLNAYSQKTLYVSKLGDDQNSGTEKSPFLTIQKGAEVAEPGDTIFVKEGTYRERVSPLRGGTEGKPITYLAEPNKNVIIKGSEIWNPDFQKEGTLLYAIPEDKLFNDDSYVDDKNPFKVEMATTPFGREGKREVERQKPGKGDLVYTLGQVYVDGEMWTQVPYKEEAKDLQKSWWYEASTGAIYLHEFSEPKNHKIEVTTRRRVFAPHLRGLGYISVKGFVMEHCGNQYPCNFWEKATPQWQQAGILGTRSGHHWTIENCVFRFGMMGLDLGYESLPSQDRGDLEKGNNGTAREPSGFHSLINNRITDCFGPGTAGMLAKNLIIRGNIFERNNSLQFVGFKRYETAALKLHSPTGSVIENNLIRDNHRIPGIWFDQGAGKLTVVKGNIIVENEKGIDLEIGDNPQASNFLIAYNIIMNNEADALSSRESGGVLAVGNLLGGSKFGYHQSADLKRQGDKWTSQHHYAFGNWFVNNETMISVKSPEEHEKFLDRQFDANVYATSSESNAFRNPTGNSTYNFSQWQALQRQWNPNGPFEANSLVTTSFPVKLNSDNLVLTFTTPRENPFHTLRDPRADTDYLGEPLSESSNQAGPFSKAKPGSQSISLWKGIRSLSPYELPYGGSELLTATSEPTFDHSSNLILNGAFAKGKDAWTFNTSDGGDGSLEITSNTCRIKVEAAGKSDWSVQLQQAGFSLLPGLYLLSYNAKASGDRTVKSEIIQHVLPQKPYLQKTANLSTDWQTYTYEFKVAAYEKEARLHFRLGKLGIETVMLKDVSLTRLK